MNQRQKFVFSASSLLDSISEFEDKIIQIRRTIHKNPELSYHEFETAKLVARTLKSMGINPDTGVGGTGVVGLLRGDARGKVVGLRADMDALPVEEAVKLKFKSRNKGVMHACGHDSHVAMLLGAAMLLSKYKKDLQGGVKFIFQPAEEHGGRGGALPMIEEGVMRNPTVDYIFGLHVLNDFPSKTFALRGGPIMASPDVFKVEILGKGGHASQPHKAIDPVYVAAQVICSLQAVSSRLLDQSEPFVLSVCNLHAGSKDNIIPDSAYFEGTIRTLNHSVKKKAKENFQRLVRSTCSAFRAKCNISFLPDSYPITYNNEKATERVFQILKDIKGTKLVEATPRMGAEDFSRFLQKAPGVFYFLGTNNRKKECVYPNHSSKFNVDEDVMKYGSVSLAKLALEFARS
jgi:carboxypeptidase Ss1